MISLPLVYYTVLGMYYIVYPILLVGDELRLLTYFRLFIKSNLCVLGFVTHDPMQVFLHSNALPLLTNFLKKW